MTAQNQIRPDMTSNTQFGTLDHSKMPGSHYADQKVQDANTNQTNNNLLLSKVNALNYGLVESHLGQQKRGDQISPINRQGQDPRHQHHQYFMFEEEKSILLDMNEVQGQNKLFAPDESEIIDNRNFLREMNGGQFSPPP